MSQNQNKDLGKSFQKMKAIEGADQRKLQVISELRNAFIRQGFSWWMAGHLAEEKYKQIHR